MPWRVNLHLYRCRSKNPGFSWVSCIVLGFRWDEDTTTKGYWSWAARRSFGTTCERHRAETGGDGGPTCQVGLSFLLLRRLAVLWWYGCVWKWCTLPNSDLNREHDDMFFKHTYILNIVKLLYIYIGYAVSTHETTWCFFTSNDLPLFPALPRSIARTLLSLQVDAAGCDLGITGLDLCHYGSRWSGFNWLRALAMKPPFPRSHMAKYIYIYTGSQVLYKI